MVAGGRMKQLAPSMWVVERTQAFGGFEIGTRMTVTRLGDGALFVHSPVSLTSELRERMDRLGAPRFAVSPNRLHHLYAGEWVSAFPDLDLFLAPGLEV